MGRSARSWAQAAALIGAASCAVIGGGGCGSDGDRQGGQALPAAAAASAKPPASAKPSATAEKRLIGTWRLDLSKVPPEALTEQFRNVAIQGKGVPEGASVHYTFTESEMVLSMAGLGSRQERRWYYEILRHSGDNLELQREAANGKKDKMAITVTDTRLRLHTGRALLELERQK